MQHFVKHYFIFPFSLAGKCIDRSGRGLSLPWAQREGGGVELETEREREVRTISSVAK